MTETDAPALLVARPSRNDVAIEHSVIIPAYNEAFRLPAVLDSLRQHVDSSTTELIVVDDGSEDETGQIARRAADWAKHLVVIQNELNQGKGAAVRTGVAAARGDTIAFVDADNATDLSALVSMRAALSPQVQAVFGSRHAPGAKVTGAPALRGVMGRLFNQVVQAAAGTTIRDTQCGAKVFSGPAARMAFGGSTVDGFAFDVEILRRLSAMGLGIVEYPVVWHHVPGTKVKLTSPLRMLRDIVRIRVSRTMSIPMHIDVDYRSDFGAFTDPVTPGRRPQPGRPCRIMLPFDNDASQAIRDLAPGSLAASASSWAELMACG